MGQVLLRNLNERGHLRVQRGVSLVSGVGSTGRLHRCRGRSIPSPRRSGRRRIFGELLLQVAVLVGHLSYGHRGLRLRGGHPETYIISYQKKLIVIRHS